MNQIEIGSDEDSSKDPKDPFTARTRSITLAIMAATALITAITALVKVMDTSLQKTSYEELAGGIQKVSEDTGKNHDDLKTLQEYLSKDRESRKEAASATPAVSAAPSSTPRAGVKVSKPAEKPTTMVVPPPTPDISPKPLLVVPPNFKSVENRAEKAAK